jgi:hypothetical protein
MRKRSLDSKRVKYYLGIGDKLESLRMVGPFSKQVEVEKYIEKHEKNVFFNPYKESFTVIYAQDKNFYLKNSKEIFDTYLNNINIVDLRDYKKKKGDNNG